MNHNRYNDRIYLLNLSKYLNMLSLEDQTFVFSCKQYYKIYRKYTKEQYDKVKELYYIVTETEIKPDTILLHYKEIYVLIQPLLKDYSYREISKILFDKHKISVCKTKIGDIINKQIF